VCCKGASPDLRSHHHSPLKSFGTFKDLQGRRPHLNLAWHDDWHAAQRGAHGRRSQPEKKQVMWQVQSSMLLALAWLPWRAPHQDFSWKPHASASMPQALR
jgi:hypothetical protein